MNETVKVFICSEWDRWSKKYVFCSWPCKPVGTDKVLIEQRDIDFDCPPHGELTAGTIAAYREEQSRIRAEAQDKVTKLETAIQDMLCLENKSDAPTPLRAA